MMNRRTSGFTLLEVLMVTVVLTVIIAAAIPAFSSSRRDSNETAAVATLRTVSQAQLQYRTRFGDFGDIGDLESASLLDAAFEDAERTGYRFTAVESPSSSTWSIQAEPITPGVTGLPGKWPR